MKFKPLNITYRVLLRSRVINDSSVSPGLCLAVDLLGNGHPHEHSTCGGVL